MAGVVFFSALLGAEVVVVLLAGCWLWEAHAGTKRAVRELAGLRREAASGRSPGAGEKGGAK